MSPAASTMRAMPASSVMSAVSETMSAAGVLGDELVEALLADVDGDHAAALAGDARCGGAADAGAGAGDDDGLAGEAALVDALGPLAQRHGGRRIASASSSVRGDLTGASPCGHVACGGAAR